MHITELSENALSSSLLYFQPNLINQYLKKYIASICIIFVSIKEYQGCHASGNFLTRKFFGTRTLFQRISLNKIKYREFNLDIIFLKNTAISAGNFSEAWQF